MCFPAREKSDFPVNIKLCFLDCLFYYFSYSIVGEEMMPQFHFVDKTAHKSVAAYKQ